MLHNTLNIKALTYVQQIEGYTQKYINELILYITIHIYLFISFCSFDPATWGHSPKDTEHVKNSRNINKATYIQSMERRQ